MRPALAHRSMYAAALLLCTLAGELHALHMPAQPGRHNKLFFLFMARDRVHNGDLWDAFFSDAVRDADYDVLLHCAEGCNEAQHGMHFRPIVVPTVRSAYCTNLVIPMVALLKRALQLPGSSNPELDKFVFVSDSTLPAKPFRLVRALLGFTKSSRFCLLPDSAPYHLHADGTVKVKTSQWFTASRNHSQVLVDAGAVFPKGYHFTIEDGRGCLDEYFPFHTLFGEFRPGDSQDCDQMEWGASRCPEAMSHYFKDLTLACDTFTSLHAGGVREAPNIRSVVGSQSFVRTESEGVLTGPHSGAIVEFSPLSLDQWRKTPYLFMRKVNENTLFVADGDETDFRSAFIKHVLT